MRVLVTGAGGFIGTALTRALLARGDLTGANGLSTPISELVLADRGAVVVPDRVGCRIEVLTGDLADQGFVETLAARRFDSIFHLAATLTLEAEQDPARAFAVNVAPLQRLIEAATRPAPRLVFTSSIAVFGGGLPATVGDDQVQQPQTTYGTHKAIVELLIADMTRRGRIDGRALRLPVVLVRSGASTPAVSDQVAAIVREPLAGRSVTCGLAPQTLIPVASARAVAAALIALHEVPSAALPAGRAINLPSLTVSIAEMVAAVERTGGARSAGCISFAPDAKLQAIVDSWPRYFVSNIATRLGLNADFDFDSIVAGYLDDENGGRAIHD